MNDLQRIMARQAQAAFFLGGLAVLIFITMITHIWQSSVNGSSAAAMNYVGFLFEDGDCDNDWLTHMNDGEAAAWKTWAQEHGLCDRGNHNGLVRKTFADGTVLITPCRALTCTYVVNGGE